MPEEFKPDGARSFVEGTGENKIYHVGTLTYTKVGLAMLFFWLLWGDFCYTLMESVTGPIMQLKFQKLDASNTEIGLILGTIPGIVYSVLNPIISFRSDRFRSRWGRRIPFILFSLPFLVFFLVALGFGDRIGLRVYAHLGPLLTGVSANQVIILTFGVLLVTFTFFNTFVTSTFWYLFNDVVPEHLLARFMSWFRVLGLASGALYSYFIFPYSASHSTEIFVSAALLYLVGFGLMIWNVREGEYPPPPPYVGSQSGLIPAVLTYAKGTHAFPHYWFLWLCTFIGGIGGGGGMFTLFMYQKVGLSLGQIGEMNGTVSITVGVLTVGAGWLADRYHPIRVVITGFAINLFVVTPATMIWLFWHPEPQVAFVVAMVIAVGFGGIGNALAGMWDPPMLMRLFPRSQYGQFCSTNAVWRAIGGIIGGGVTGAFLDFITPWVGKENVYYYLPVWGMLFGIPSFYLFYRLYQSWKQHGGDDAYVAPVLESISSPVPGALFSVSK